MTDRTESPDEDLDRPETAGVSGPDALGVLVVAVFLAAVGLVTYLLTSAVALS